MIAPARCSPTTRVPSNAARAIRSTPSRRCNSAWATHHEASSTPTSVVTIQQVDETEPAPATAATTPPTSPTTATSSEPVRTIRSGNIDVMTGVSSRTRGATPRPRDRHDNAAREATDGDRDEQGERQPSKTQGERDVAPERRGQESWRSSPPPLSSRVAFARVKGHPHLDKAARILSVDRAHRSQRWLCDSGRMIRGPARRRSSRREGSLLGAGDLDRGALGQPLLGRRRGCFSDLASIGEAASRLLIGVGKRRREPLDG